MNPKDIIRHQPAIFPNADDWVAFNNLVAARGGIIHEWFRAGSHGIRENLIRNPRDGWSVASWGNGVDLKIFLDDFGAESLFIGYGWSFQFHLFLGDVARFDTKKADELLKTPRFNLIFEGFERIDRSFEKNVKAMNNRNFHFGSIHDGNLSEEELAWYAGNQTEEFVSQAIRQIDRIASDERITQALRELNREIQIAAAS